MTKDLVPLFNGNAQALSTDGFLDALSEALQAELA